MERQLQLTNFDRFEVKSDHLSSHELGSDDEALLDILLIFYE